MKRKQTENPKGVRQIFGKESGRIFGEDGPMCLIGPICLIGPACAINNRPAVRGLAANSNALALAGGLLR